MRGADERRRKAFDKAVEAAKLDDFRFHDPRHTAASYLVMRGASLADVRAAVSPLDGLTRTRREATATAQEQHKAGRIEAASSVSA